jgi:hypothetical protein
MARCVAALDLIMSVREANRPNGGESVGLRQYVNIASDMRKFKQEGNNSKLKK